MIVDFRVSVGGGAQPGEVSARLYESGAGGPSAWLILAPGAGAGHDHPFMVGFGRGLAARGLNVVTFDFPYLERRRRAPDPTTVLERCWVAVFAKVSRMAGRGASLFAGGKSMGGRIASQVAAAMGETAAAPSPGAAQSSSFAIRGLVFLGYPLHPPGHPEQRRTAHWPAVRVPALFVSGTRDPFAAPEELREELPRYAGETSVFVVVDGDHSLKVPRKIGRTQEEVIAEVQDAIVRWVSLH